MQSDDRHDPVRPLSSGTQPDAPEEGPPEDFLRMMKWIRQAQSDAERLESADKDSAADLEDEESRS